MTSSPLLEPSPFDDDDDGPVSMPRRRPTDPFLPMTQEELDRVLKTSSHMRLLDPWKCAYNVAPPEGGIPAGAYSRFTPAWQCRTRIADPTKARYCVDHAQELGVAFYSPDEAAAMTVAESTANLTRLIPKAIRAIERVMDDQDAPAGVVLKSAETVLDRTGYTKGVDIKIDAKVSIEDPMEKLRGRLTVLRDAQMEVAERLMTESSIVDAEIVDGPETA